MKKVIALVLSLVLCLSLFAGCGKVDDAKVIKVAASPTPHALILKTVADVLAEDGWTLEVIEYSDYVIPNNVVEDGEVDANYFQHVPYLDTFNAENGTHLVSVAAIHYEPFAIYPGTKVHLEDLVAGDKIAIPNDGSNRARALMLLEDAGLIKLTEGVGMQATVLDITEYSVDVKIIEMEAAQLANIRDDVAFAVINGNYALHAGLFAGNDGIWVEDPENANVYANVLVVKEGNENSEKTKALIAALQSETVQKYLETVYPGSVVPCF